MLLEVVDVIGGPGDPIHEHLLKHRAPRQSDSRFAQGVPSIYFLSWGLLALTTMCAVVAIFQPDRQATNPDAEPPATQTTTASEDPPRSDHPNVRTKLLESLRLQPVSMLTEAKFTQKHGLPVRTNGSGDYCYLYYPTGDFTVQLNLAEKITDNVYDGRMR